MCIIWYILKELSPKISQIGGKLTQKKSLNRSPLILHVEVRRINTVHVYVPYNTGTILYDKS